ncbi:MAG: hypothetical protein Q9205_007772, partial [Flavoplaca limonia]
MAPSPRRLLRRNERTVSLPLLLPPPFDPSLLLTFNLRGLNQSYGVFQAYYETVLLRTQSPSSIAWIGSLQIFLLFFMSIFVSTQMDKGRFQHCFTGGSILLTVSVLATSFCT